MYYGRHLGVYVQLTVDMVIILLICYHIIRSNIEMYGHITDTYGQFFICIIVKNKVIYVIHSAVI